MRKKNQNALYTSLSLMVSGYFQHRNALVQKTNIPTNIIIFKRVTIKIVLLLPIFKCTVKGCLE